LMLLSLSALKSRLYAMVLSSSLAEIISVLALAIKTEEIPSIKYLLS